MSDIVETIGASKVQHGTHNDRVYLMHLAPEDGPDIVEKLARLAERGGYPKIFAKVPPTCVPWFTECGYVTEAEIPAGPGTPGLAFVSRFMDPARARPQNRVAVKEVLAQVLTDSEIRPLPGLLPGLRELPGRPNDAAAIARLYDAVFDSYPFPIHEPEFIGKSMQSGVAYYTVRDNRGSIVAVSSAEPAEGQTVLEMTDFATDPAFRGRGLARRLLATMDRDALRRGIPLTFTIARALSVGMNLAFRRSKYRYAGTLVNNTNISGGLESMNVWYKYAGR